MSLIKIGHSEVLITLGFFISLYRIWQNFREGKLLRLCVKYTIHWKTLALHHAVAIMYYTQQMIQGENFCNRLKNCENPKSFPPQKFCHMVSFKSGCVVTVVKHLKRDWFIVLR